jgi:7-alpha-hydroxysteroid dehydrogenase
VDPNQFSLAGRVALVTGSGRGIGAAIARAFADAGASVAVVARTTSDVEGVAAELRAAGGNAVAFTADVTDLDQLPSLVERTVQEFDGLDVLVNNAGGEVSPSFLETRVSHIEEAVHFNVSVPFELSRLAVPHLLQRPGASIINIGSIVVGKSVRGHLAHHVGKAAQAQLTLSMAADLGPRIRVNAILPAAIETDALRRYFEAKADLRDQLRANARMRRIGTPEDVALSAVFLASSASSWMTAKLIELDGGPVDGIMEYEPDL